MDGKVVINTELNTSDIDRQIDLLIGKLEQLEQEYNSLSNTKPFEGQEEALRKVSTEIMTTKKRLTSLINEKEKLNKSGMSGFMSSLNDVGNSITKLMKKVVRWGLAIFGIRSAYLAVRAAASTLSSYNDQIATDIEYIRFALATALQPIVEAIIRLVYKLLSVINAISIALFNYPLFANATASAFNKTAKSAEKVKKSLAGFDEMNVVQDTSGKGDDIKTPSMDLSQVNQDAQGYVNTMKKAVEDTISFWEEEWQRYYDEAGESGNMFVQGLLLTGEGFYQSFKGIWDMISGLIDIFVGIFTGDTDKLQEGWDKFCQGIGELFQGLVEIIVGLLKMLLGIIIDAIVGVWNSIVNILGVVGSWIYDNIIKPIADFFAGLWNGIVKGVKSAFNGIKNIFSSIVSFFSGIVNSILKLFKTIGTNVGNVIASAFKAVVNGILKAIESILNAPIKAINGLISIINAIPGIKLGKLKTFSLPRLAKGGIVNMPGRGVPVGGAITGEAGREGVIPLTDSQQMAMLGEAIGKYITVDITNITNLDGRQIARKVEQINQNNRFVLNR